MTMKQTVAVRWRDLPKERPVQGLVRCAVASDDAMIVHNLVYADMEASPHDHPFAQVALFTAGRGVFEVAGVRHDVAKGSVVVVPAGATHNLEALSDEPLENIDIFVPVRSDYRHLLSWMEADPRTNDGPTALSDGKGPIPSASPAGEREGGALA